MLFAVLVAAAFWPPALALLGLLGLPVVGLHHMAGLIARGEAVAFSDFLGGMRRHWRAGLALGFAAIALAFVFSVNILLGLEIGGVGGWVFSAFALYGDIGLAMYLVVAWPLVSDPLRQDQTIGRRLRVAALVVLARPGRIFALAAAVSALVVISAFLFAVLLTVTIAYVALVTTRYVLPAADRLEGRLTRMVGQ